MKLIKIISIIAISLVIIAFIALKNLTVYIPIDCVGVRTQQFGILGQKGVHEKDYAPGWHRNLGPIDSWVIFNSSVQTMELSKKRSQPDSLVTNAITITTADGGRVTMDITVKFRIMKDKAHLLLKKLGAGNTYKNTVYSDLEKACIDEFSKMKTEDFYNPKYRDTHNQKIMAWLTKSLKENYIELIDVLIRDIEFNPDFERRILETILAEQEAALNQSKNALAEATGKTQIIQANSKRKVDEIQEDLAKSCTILQAEMELKLATIKAEAEAYAIEKRSEADKIAVEKKATGELLIAQAEAKGTIMRNQAMQGEGGNTMAALEAAKNITFGKISISTQTTNILDLEKMTTILGATPTKKQK